MERIVIIDHENHCVFIEEIDEEFLELRYGGEEEKYILDNYDLGHPWSWEYITEATYIPKDGDPIDIIDEMTDFIYQ